MPSVRANAWNPSSACCVRGRDVLSEACVLEIRVLGTDTRVIEPR